MGKAMIIFVLATAILLTGCQSWTPGEKGAAVGAAAGSGIGLLAGGSFPAVLGAGLVGGAVGYVGGSAIGDR